MVPSPTQDENDADRSVAGAIAQALAMRIVQGHLLPDAPIRQDHIAAEFSASHVPVREAFRKLEGQGLVVSQPRRGVRVAPLDHAALVEVTQMRAALECLALRHALPKMAEADFVEAEAALAANEASRDIIVWEAANRRFHNALLAPCGWPRLLATIADLQRVAARFLFAAWRHLHWQPRSAREHDLLLAAFRQRDLAQANEILRAHVLGAGEALLETLNDGPKA